MDKNVKIIGGGLAGSECALQLAQRGVHITLVEMRPETKTDVHQTSLFGELVCSNSLKSTNPETAAGMLKHELCVLNSALYECALNARVAAGGALAVDRNAFAEDITYRICHNTHIRVVRREAKRIEEEADGFDAVVLATGPLTSDKLAQSLKEYLGCEQLAFYDAAAPIVMADTLDYDILFQQSRYEQGAGDYLNAPFTKQEYEQFIHELLGAQRVIQKEFETQDLFQACQPIEEIARKGIDAPRYGALKPVGLCDPHTGKRPWAAVQLRAENVQKTCFNLVGFQTNLTFSEQKRVFRMIPGLHNVEFARFGVMHKNTFVNAPRVLDENFMVKRAAKHIDTPVFLAGQISGTEGYTEAIRSGLHVALALTARLQGKTPTRLSCDSVFGALVDYATNSETLHYQPSHVNFGLLKPLDPPIKNKKQRYAAYASRAHQALVKYSEALCNADILNKSIYNKHVHNAHVESSC